LPAALASGVQI